MSYFRLCIALLLGSQFLSACEAGEKKTSLLNKYADEEIVHIHQLQDEQNSTGLLAYFDNTNELYRAEAALSFASVQDSIAIPALMSLLNDKNAQVRKAAAYSLGQLGNDEARNALCHQGSVETDPEVHGTILESIGKLISSLTETKRSRTISGDTISGQIQTDAITYLDTVHMKSNYEYNGWGKAVFRMNSNKVYSEELMDRMRYILQYSGPENRIICAHAMARYKGEWLVNNKDYIFSWLQTERDPSVRAPLMTALGKIGDKEARRQLIGYASDATQDKNVTISALRALHNFHDVNATDLLPALNHSDDSIILEALHLIKETGYERIIPQIREKCASQGAEVQATILQLAALTGEKASADTLWNKVNNTTSLYDKTFFLRALGSFPDMWEKVVSLVISTSEHPLQYVGTEALVEMQNNKNKKTPIPFYTGIWLPCMKTNDAGIISLMAAQLREEKLSDIQKKESNTLLAAYADQLQMPRDIETYNEIAKTINFLGIEKREEKKGSVNHAINWDLVKQIPEGQKAIVHTAKGDFTISLDVNSAPGTVSNFVQLSRDGFYNKKFFHRVIPAFVAQGGCPRGDGMGSTDYTIRSEFDLHNYIPGAVGMASAGKDTESCQWFATLAYTPHLEGRYTIFGYVTEGMDVVQMIRIGDQIESIEILKGSEEG